MWGGMYCFLVLCFFGLSDVDADMAEWGGQFGYEFTPQPGVLKMQIIFGIIVLNLKMVNLGSKILIICISKTHNILFPKTKGLLVALSSSQTYATTGQI